MSEYNTAEDLLRESISSILKQTYKNIEFIIVDDRGKNDVQKIVNTFNDSRIKVIRNKKNMGLVDSLNYAIENSNGKYIARMDTDDYSHPERIETQVKFLEEHPEFILVSGNAKFYDGRSIIGCSNWYGEVTANDLKKGSSHIIHPSVMMRAKELKLLGGYKNYRRCEDYALWIEMIVSGYRCYVMDDILIRYHLSTDDYKKRSLKTRKDFFRLLKEQYIRLNPTKLEYMKLYLKTIIARDYTWPNNG